MNNSKKTYSSKDVAKRLSIQPVTVRKYSQMLENKGYSFTKDQNEWRLYNEDDIEYLRYLSNMKAMGKSLDESIDHIATLYHSKLSIAQPDITLQSPAETLLKFIENQQEFNQKILERLEAQEQRQAERDKNLMNALRESQEVKKQLAAATQKKWWQFWK